VVLCARETTINCLGAATGGRKSQPVGGFLPLSGANHNLYMHLCDFIPGTLND
jgi:hypothetical protein